MDRAHTIIRQLVALVEDLEYDFKLQQSKNPGNDDEIEGRAKYLSEGKNG